MVHWLQIGGMKIREKDEIKQWGNLNEYIQKYPLSKSQVWLKTTGDMYARFIKLECEQSYDELDLDCNSISDGSIKRLGNKPSNVEVSSKGIECFFDYYSCKSKVV